MLNQPEHRRGLRLRETRRPVLLALEYVEGRSLHELLQAAPVPDISWVHRSRPAINSLERAALDVLEREEVLVAEFPKS